MSNPFKVVTGAVIATASVIAAPAIGPQLAAVGFSYGVGRAIDGLRSEPRERIVARIEGQKFTVRSTQAPLPVIYGTARTGVKIVDARVVIKGTNNGGTSATTPDANPDDIFTGADDNDVLCLVGAFALGSEDGSGVESIDKIRMYDDGVDVITTPSAFGSAPSPTNVIAKYGSNLKYTLQGGTDAQTVQTDLENSLGWSVGGRNVAGRGVAYGAFYCEYDEEVWTDGFPNVTAEVKGNKVYDPRSSLWAWSDNPALCILDYITSDRYGAGVPYQARDAGDPLDFIDEQSFEDAANYCDDLVSIPGGGNEKRFVMNAIIPTNRATGANLQEMLATCRGELVWQNGKYRLVIREGALTADPYELTEDQIVGSMDWVRRGAAVPNVIEATFPDDQSGDYTPNTVIYPPVGTTTYVTEDNGVENRVEIALPYTSGRYQAERTIQTMLKEARADLVCTLTAHQSAYALQVGDVVNVTHSGPGWVQKPFLVRAMSLTADALVNLGLQEYDSSAYTLALPDTEPTPDDTELPDQNRQYITVGMSGDRFVSQGATTSGGVAAQEWHRRLQLRAGSNTRSLRFTYDFDRPDIPGGTTSTNFSRNYTIDVSPDSEVTHTLEDGASSAQSFIARDDNGTTRYDEAISVTITPYDTAGGAGQAGKVVTTAIRDLALEDDLGFRVDAEVEVVEANYAEANGDAWFSFTTSIAYFAQGFTMPAGTDRDLASVEVYLQRVGSPAGDVNLYVYDNNTTPTPDEPNASVAAATTSVDASTLSASGQVVRLDMDRVSLTAGGSYWVVVEHIDSSGTDYVQIRVDESSPNGSDMTDTATSPEIVSWTVTSASTRQAAGFYVRRFGTQVVPTRQLAPAADKSAKFTWQADGTVALASITSASGGATTLAGLTDTTITTPSPGDFLRYNGSTWLNTTLVAGDIPNLDTSKITTGTFADARIAESNVTQHEAALSVLGIEALSDPNADRIFFWDDSAGTGGAFAFLEVAGGLEIPVSAPTTIQVDVGDGIALSGGEVVFDASVLNDEGVAMVAGDRFVVWDSGEAGTGSRQMNPSNIPLSLFNDDLGFSQNVEGAGIALSTTTGTNDTIALDYLGADSFIAEAPAGSIVSSDEILFMDVNDSSNVKRDLVSSLPFTNNAGTVTEVTVGTGLDVTTGTTTPNITVDLDELSAGGTLVATDSLVAVNGIATEKQLISAIPLGIFSNNLGWTSNAGTVTQVDGTGTVSGLTLTGSVTSSGSLTLGGTLSVLEGDIVDGSILARVASDETISGSYTFTDQDGIFVNVGAGGLYLQNSAFHATSLITAGLKYVPGGGADNSPYDRLNWEYTDAAGASNNAGSAVIMKGNGTETGLSVEWYTAPTSTGAGANPASLTKRLDITTAAFEYGTSAQFRVTSAGLITAGEWDATTIAVAHGGTGISGGIAADQFLIGDGTGNPYVASGANLVWSGTQLTINDATIAHTGTGGFTGDGSGLNNVSADSSTVSNLTTEVATYYPMLSDGASGSVSHFVNSTDLRWKNTATANQLLLANGAEATPIIGFINDEDTGVYLASTGNLSLATGGSRIANFGTGMTLYGTLNIEQNAVSRFARMTRTDLTDLTWDVRIDAAGDLEIRSTTDAGVTTLNALQMVHATGDLTLKGWVRSEDGAVGAPTWGFSSDTNTGMWLNGTGILAFTVGGANRFQIDEIAASRARAQFDATQVYNTEGARITASGNVTLDWDEYNQVDITNDGTARTVTIDDNSMQDGGHYVLVIDYTSGLITSWTWSATGTLQWQGGSAPTLPNATVGDRTVITFVKTGGITLGFYADAPA